MVILAPSILTADYTRIVQELDAARKGGCRWVHLDVMDGHFVPNITFGPGFIGSLRKATDLTFDVHLMISDFDGYAERFAGAGADYLTFHLEAVKDPIHSMNIAKDLGCRVGMAVNPGTPVPDNRRLLEGLDLLLLMSVEPGFGGQGFIPSVLEKIAHARTLREKYASASGFLIQVDGGIKVNNVASVVRAGADVIVSGSGVFDGKGDPAENARRILEAAHGR